MNSRNLAGNLILALVMIFINFPLGATPISSDDFQLTNSEGKVTARLTTSGEGTPALFFFDRDGKNRMVLSLYPEGVGGVVLNDSQGRAAAILRLAGKNERPVLVLKANGMDKMIVGLRDDDSSIPYMEPMPHETPNVKSSSAGFTQSLWFYLATAALAGFLGGKMGARIKSDAA